MKSIIRSIVSSPKNSHYDAKLDIQFDLSYITPQLIVCSGPVNSYFKSLYRYPVSDLIKFLNYNHNSEYDSRWHIWNFRGEEPGYDDEDVLNKVSHYPFPDHQSPTMDIILKSVKEIDAFLSQSPKNVAVLHCKAGKGRSGTICCAYLLYKSFINGDLVDPVQVIEVFTSKRMKSFTGSGISILSQRRYLEYWWRFLNSSNELKQNILFYAQSNVEIYKQNMSCITMITIHTSENSLNKLNLTDLNLILQTYVRRKDNENGVEIKDIFALTNNAEIQVKGKIIYIIPIEPIYLSQTIKDIRMSINGWCYSWFNIYFETLSSSKRESLPDTSQYTQESLQKDSIIKGRYSIDWNQLDGFKGTQQRGLKLFDYIDIFWRLYY